MTEVLVVEAITRGEQGPPGDFGGPQGPEGPPGPTGPVGPAGPAGDPGEQGEDGQKGADGATGPAGATGATGPAGPQGTPGTPGAQGPQGTAGTAGAKGDKGDKGDTGSIGVAGPQGVPGANGADGATGPRGFQGDPGATGATGPQGPTGAQGPQGTAGLGIQLQGHVATIGDLPAPGTRQPGDAWVVDADGKLYAVNQTKTAYIDAGQIVGPAGPQGATGSQGPAGTPGAQGPIGNTGAQGPQGVPGTAGATGAQGPVGAAGAKGDKGDTGTAGTTGAQGATGATGAQGIQGPAGAKGDKGDTGATGAQGPAGTVTLSQPIVGALIGFPGPPDVNTYVSTLWPAPWVTLGDIDIRALIQPDKWVGSANTQYIIGSYDGNASPTQHSFGFHFTTAGKLVFSRSYDGVTMLADITALSVPGVTDGRPKWVRVAFKRDNGGGNGQTVYYTSNDGVTWTAFETKVITGTQAVHNSAHTVRIGTREGGGIAFGGIFHMAEIRNDGVVGAGIDFRGRYTGVGSGGNTWTISGTPYWYVEPPVTAYDKLASGTSLTVFEPATGGWPANPRLTSRTDIPHFWKGPDQPAIISGAGTSGMIDGVDTYLRTPV